MVFINVMKVILHVLGLMIRKEVVHQRFVVQAQNNNEST